MDFNPSGFSLSKSDNRMPQTVLRTSYYPMPNFEVTGYYFPDYEESELFKSVSYDDQYQTYLNTNYYWEKVVPSGSSAASSAARVVWYHPKFTSAITYSDGFNHILGFRRQLLGYDLSDDGSSVKAAYFKTQYGYFSKKAVGAEFSIPMGSMTMKVDATISEDVLDDDYNVDILNQLEKYNNGYANIPVYQRFVAFGIDADFDTWFFNVYVLNIGYFKKSGYDAIWDAYNRILEMNLTFWMCHFTDH